VVVASVAVQSLLRLVSALPIKQPPRSIYLFIQPCLTSFSHDGYVDKNQSKHKTEQQITEGKQITQNAKYKKSSSLSSVLYLFGDEAPLANKIII
jgi:hypothetical protein